MYLQHCFKRIWNASKQSGMRKFHVFRKVSEIADTFSELRKFLVIDQSKSTEHSTVKTANYTETIRKYLNLSKVSQYTESFCEH